MPSVNTRVFFSKMERAKYISHLDLNNVMQRAVRRAGLPVWYTEGFAPHMYLQFMLPLSLGQEGLHEAMDFRLLEEVPPDEVTKLLNNSLPHDIRITETTVPVYKNTDIDSAEYEIEADIDREKFGNFISSEHIITEKKTKKGITEIDLKPNILGISIGKKIIIRLPAGNFFNINPELLLDAYKKETGESFYSAKIVRTRIFCKDGNLFR